jgi:transcriptional regulator with XRE-family HTH domain
MTWWEYVQRVSAHASNKDIAAKAGTDASTITRWKQGDKPRAETVVAFAHGYNQSAVEALIAAGYITEDDIPKGTIQLQQSIREVPDGEFIAEMQRRLANNDPRKIEPGSAEDVFPQWGESRNKRRQL